MWENFSQISNLNVHKRTHTEEKCYEFSRCEKIVINHSSVKTHMGSHTDTNPINLRTVESPSAVLCIVGLAWKFTLENNMQTMGKPLFILHPLLYM